VKLTGEEATAAMRIERVEVSRLSVPLIRPYRLSFGDLVAFDTLLVELIDADGRISFGEATVLTGYTDETIDPFAYPNAFPDAWRQFRQVRLTRLVAQVRAAIAAALPGIPVTAVVSGTAESDLEDHLQDWRSWIESRLVDAVSVRSGATTTIVSDVNALLRIVSTAQASGSN